jgi:glutamyl-tRNA synthetase
MLGFLFVDDDAFTIEPESAAAVLKGNAGEVLTAAVAALEPLDDWSTAAIEAALRSALVEGLGLKPKLAFGPVRVAVTGRRISPPLFESLELLGQDRALRRLRAATSQVA